MKHLLEIHIFNIFIAFNFILIIEFHDCSRVACYKFIHIRISFVEANYPMDEIDLKFAKDRVHREGSIINHLHFNFLQSHCSNVPARRAATWNIRIYIVFKSEEKIEFNQALNSKR